MAKKEITVQFKLQAPGGTATPAPPIGPALGQHGVNPGQFIQRFNAMSAHLKGKVIGVLVTVYKDRTFDIELKLSLIHISEPTRLLSISYAVFCLKKKK